MKLTLKLIIIIISLFSVLQAQTEERKNLAIYTFTGLGVTDIEARVISDRIRVEIAKIGTFDTIERGLMEQILEEQALQLSGLCEESSCLVEVGRILAVHYMVGGSVSKIGNLYSIEARVIDVESGKIITSVTEDYNGPIENLLVQTTKIVASKLSGKDAASSFVLTGTCDLLVKSSPPGGTIYLNNKPVGDVTPYKLQGIREGNYLIQVRNGNLVGSQSLILKKYEQKEITLNLKREEFIIRIQSEPIGAYVVIDNQNIGKTPVDYVVVDTTRQYNVHLKKDGYFDISDISFFDGENLLRLNYNLEVCGRLKIITTKNAVITINNIPIDSVGILKIIIDDEKSAISFVKNKFQRFIKPTLAKEVNQKTWQLDQLRLMDYSISIEEEERYPFVIQTSLTELALSREIVYLNNNKIDKNVTPLADIDGNIYKMIKIGNQTWMAENLRVTRYRNGDANSPITAKRLSDENIGTYSVYNNDMNNIYPYGYFYNWYAVTDIRDLAPEGWHIPSIEEWKILINYLGGRDVAGNKLKASDMWENGSSGDNSSGFTALPGGYCNNRNQFYNDIGLAGYYWLKSDYNDTNSMSMQLTFGSNAFIKRIGKEYDISVRCIKD